LQPFSEHQEIKQFPEISQATERRTLLSGVHQTGIGSFYEAKTFHIWHSRGDRQAIFLHLETMTATARQMRLSSGHLQPHGSSTAQGAQAR
jgi:hypothetical protein